MSATSDEEGGNELTLLCTADQGERTWCLWPNRARAWVAVSLFSAAGFIGSGAVGLRLPAQRLAADTAWTVGLSALNKEGLDLGKRYFREDKYNVVQSAVDKLLDAGATYIVVACFSQQLLALTNNWICSWASNPGNVKKAAVLLFAMDGNCTDLSTGFRDAGGLFLCVPIETKKPPGGPVSYRSKRYTFMCGAKLALFSWTMHAADQRGRALWFLYSDVDIVIRRDVFLYLESHLHSRDVQDQHWQSPNPPQLVFQHSMPTGGGMNTGFYFARTGLVALNFFKGGLEYLQAGKTKDGADQGAIQRYFGDTKDMKWPIGLLPKELFPTGQIYFMTNGLNASDNWIALHANYLKGPDSKHQCLVVTGNWFLDDAIANKNTCVAPKRRKDWVWEGGGVGGPCKRRK